MSSDAIVRFLSTGFDEALRDPVWGTILLSPGLAALAACPALVKLDGILQLGPAHLVYPGATHTRRAHSIGVCHAARRLLLALGEKGMIDFVSREGAASFLAAALCHDLGHFPFAHSLKELPLADHETLTGLAIREGRVRASVEASGADTEMAAAIVDADLPDRGSREIRFFRGLLSGVLDPDKLDYLNRDAFFCGVPYGIQDSDFILRRVAVDGADRLGVDGRGIMSIEGILFSKYLMYRSVYWHKSVRAATAMIKKAVVLALNEGVLAGPELYGLDDAGFFHLLASRDYSPFSLARDVREGRLFQAVLDIPFEPAKPAHAALLDLERRCRVEAEIAALLALKGRASGSLDVVIDIPEPVSFESDLPVIGHEGGRDLPFTESATVFAPAVIAGFSNSLRRLRVFCRAGQGGIDPDPETCLIVSDYFSSRS